VLRARLIPAATFVILGVVGLALGGCSSASAPSWMPSWLTIKPPPPPTQALQFESEPPGADVHTVDGQTCRTPCSLALPLTTQSVSFGLNGYLPQTVPVAVAQSGEPSFQPNPVQVTLQSEKPVAKPKPRKAHVAAKNTPKPPARPSLNQQPSIMAPESAAQQDNAFPPPPQMASPSSPFPPPPQTR
jgi:PEGA domain-containing protein